MDEFRKEIQINEHESIQYIVDNSGYIPMHMISDINNNEIHKNIKFNRWDDYSFQSWYHISYEEYKDKKIQNHIFHKTHPLYILLLHLLNGKEELIIDDDETCEMNKKYMRIYINNSDINIDFINNLENDKSFSRFYVFIKNIVFDLRSKIDCLELDTKERLYFFFKEIHELFKEEYHQITIEEYLLDNNLLTLEESKKYVKTFKPIGGYQK